MTDKQSTLDKIEVMQHYADGGKVELLLRTSDQWVAVTSPFWNWEFVGYRKAVTKPSINWSHVAPEYKWLARDESEEFYLFETQPRAGGEIWIYQPGCTVATPFTSLTPGTCGWEDSLVQRPEEVT